MPEFVVPLPALPAASVTPVLSRVITLLEPVMPLVGVKVAVQVVPPLLELTLPRVPLAMVRSALVKPVTASLNVKVAMAVSPTRSAVSFSEIVAVGRWVSMVKLLELVDPVPAFDVAMLVTPVMSTLMALDVSVTPPEGVNVAAQVRPPSLELTLLSVPFGMVRSALVKPSTASLKVKVTCEVSPTLSAVSATVTLTVGRTSAGVMSMSSISAVTAPPNDNRISSTLSKAEPNDSWP